MKYYLASAFFMLAFTTFGQWNIAAGYTYQIDHPAPQERLDIPQDKENPYVQHEVTLQGGYSTQHNWEFSVGASYLPHEDDYYQDVYTHYSDCGAGGCTSWTNGNRYQAKIMYAYAGVGVSVRKWIGFEKTPWLQLGFGAFQKNDFLVAHTESNGQRQSYSATSVWYDNPDFTDTHTYTESEWEPFAGEMYQMRKFFASMGAELSFRFRFKGFFLQPSVSYAFSGHARYKQQYFNWSIGELPEPALNVLNTWYGMPAFSCRIGYLFPARPAK